MTIDGTSRRGNIRDVAAHAGVSTATVSNALNHPGRVAPATLDRVKTAIEATGYIPNAAASRLRALENKAIGILVTDVGNFFHAELAKGAQHVAEESGFTSLLCDGDREVARTIKQIDFLESQQVAGVLATGSSIPAVGERLQELRRRGVAVVAMDAPTDDPEQCSVAVDDLRGGEIVGRHLLSIGRKRISYVQTDFVFGPFDDRCVGLQRVAGDAVVSIVRAPIASYEDGVEAAEAVIAAESDAVFCMNDHMAFGVLRELLRRGVRVPEDIAVVGYDDTQFASMAAVPLTSVRQPATVVGATAAKLLLEECGNSPHEHARVMYQPELIVRDSTVEQPRPVASIES